MILYHGALICSLLSFLSLPNSVADIIVSSCSVYPLSTVSSKVQPRCWANKSHCGMYVGMFLYGHLHSRSASGGFERVSAMTGTATKLHTDKIIIVWPLPQTPSSSPIVSTPSPPPPPQKKSIFVEWCSWNEVSKHSRLRHFFRLCIPHVLNSDPIVLYTEQIRA